MIIDNSEFTASIDFCLFFPSTEESNGTVYIQGWLYEKRPKREQPLIEVEVNQALVASFSRDMERPDVQNQWREAPLQSGFMAYIPGADVSWLSSPLSIYCRSGLTKSEIAEVAIFDIDNLLKVPQLDKQLTAPKRIKVENLILNEKERIHRVTSLRSQPLYLIIDPSFSCQLKCPYCHGNMTREAGISLPKMEPDMVDSILERYGDTLIQAHFFNWGEPFLNKELPLFISKAHERDIWTTCSSNFSLNLTEDFLDSIILSGLDLLIVSVDGMTQAAYEKYRVGGNLELVLSNLRKLAARKAILGAENPHIRFQFLDFPWTRDQIEVARSVAMDVGANEFHVKAGCIHPPKKISASEQAAPQKTRMNRQIQDRLIQLQQAKNDSFKFFGCDHLYHQLSINSDGSVHPCCYVYEPKHTAGNILDDENCFNNAVMQSHRSVFKALDKEAVHGYDPCANCWILGDQEAKGHKESTISFQPAFEMIVKQPLGDFINTRTDNWLASIKQLVRNAF